MGVPFWWPSVVPDSITIPIPLFFIFAATFSGLLLLFAFMYLRWRSNRSLEIKAALHTLSHEIRDEQNKVYRRVANKNDVNKSDEEVHLYEYCGRLSNLVSEFFKSQIINKGIEVGIRLAIESLDSSTTEIVYSTFGRSNGLNSKRSETTVDIPSNEGIPRFLIELNCKGILIYNDLEAASDMKAFKMTPNDKEYKDEIVTMMVAPMNGWDGKKSSMIGLLYVTSRKKGAFKAKHVDAMRFAADIVATSVAFTVNTLKNGGRIKAIKKGGLHE